MDYFATVHSMLSLLESRAGNGADRLADELGYSEAHLRDVFSRHVGMPLMRYVMRRRISNAAFDALYSDASLTDIAIKYGFESYDTFTRAFRRVAGLTPSEFRKKRPRMERRSLGGGIYGMFIAAQTDDMSRERKNNMNKHTDEHSTILYGVPKVRYGAFNGACTPYPMCIKACANYLGEDIDYADAIVGCGAAFRLAWSIGNWDGGNVDICHTFEEGSPDVYLNGLKALGRGLRVYEGKKDKNEFKAFIKAALDEGLPVIAMGIVGPPEAGIVTGYRDDGNVLLGWSVFQDAPDYGATVHIDESGYYITDRWWENGVDGMLVMGEREGGRWSDRQIVAQAIRALEPRREGDFAKGIAAYDAWRDDISNESEFTDADKPGDPLGCANELRPEGAEEVIPSKIMWRLMCNNDAIDCLHDGRGNAARYFASRAEQNPLYGEIAKHFREVADVMRRMYEIMGGFWRDERAQKRLAQRQTRERLCALIDVAKAADTRAYELLKQI